PAWGTAAGTTSWWSTRRRSAGSWPGTGAARSRPPGTGSWPPPTGRPRPADAIRAGVGELGLEVRVGLHTGECELLGDDIGGIAVHIAARVLAQAGAGEICCSRTGKDLVAGSGFDFRPRGTRSPKGVPHSWQPHAVE